MPQVTGLTRGGSEWIPQFVTDLNQEKCIGCGRCYKVCPRDVLDLVAEVRRLRALAKSGEEA